MTALAGQVATSVVFWVGACYGWYGLPMTIVLFFVCLSCLGLVGPNASALALAPFSTNVGSASALMGLLQIGLSALATSTLALFSLTDSVPVAAMMTVTSAAAMTLLLSSRGKIGE